MNKTIKTITLSLVSVMILSTLGQAKECYNAQGIDVTWTSYKTLAKIGVGGNFSDVTLGVVNKNASDIKTLLTGSSVQTTLDSIDAHLALKNSNIATYFTANLDAKSISAKIISVTNKGLQLEITLNKITKVIPMKYTVAEGKVHAEGVIDALDFRLIRALRTLNTNVAGHKKKGWNDISIGFDMSVTSTCK